MKKSLSLLILITLLVTSKLHSQKILQRSWSDGDPTFSRIVTSQNVIIDSTIHLIPIIETSKIDTSFILYGQHSVWANDNVNIKINGAIDIDFFANGNDQMYLVTTDMDGNGSGDKVWLVNYTDPDNIPLPTDFTANLQPFNIVDALIFDENGETKVLIIDEGKNSVIKVRLQVGQIVEEWNSIDSDLIATLNPSDATILPQSPAPHLIFIADQRNNGRVILVYPRSLLQPAEEDTIIWSYGEGVNEEIDPVDIEYDSTIHGVLITDQSNHQVILVSMHDDSVVWRFGTGVAGNSDNTLDTPTDADLLENGNILICDTGNNRLLEVNRNREIVWRFEHRPLINLRDADRLTDNRTVIIAETKPPFEQDTLSIPIWLGYSDSTFNTKLYSIREPVSFEEKYVSFDSLFWDGKTPPDTRIKLQFRSSDNSLDLVDAPWRGPSTEEDTFTDSFAAVNPLYHTAHSHFQFRVLLETDNLLYTPRLDSIGIRYHFYDKGQTGQVMSEVIADSTKKIITKWLNLDYDAIEPAAADLQINILDGTADTVLVENAEKNQPLFIWNNLTGVQSVRMEGILTTQSTAFTPILNDWAITWESTDTSNSQIDFIDADENPVSVYRLPSVTNPPDEKFVDQVAVRLMDPNLTILQDTISLKIKTLQSGDELKVRLIKNPGGEFLLRHSIPAVIIIDSTAMDKSNDSLEVYNRDQLTVSYRDPKYPMDQSSDSVLIVQNTIGDLQIVNSLGSPIDTLVFRNSKLDSVKYDSLIYISVTGEKDHDITTGQDSLNVFVRDNKTGDEEKILLKELLGSENFYSTGNFMSTSALPITNAPSGTPNNKQLETLEGNQIAANYNDNVLLQDFVYVKVMPDTIPELPSAQVVLDVMIAPNPFRANEHSVLKIKTGSTIANLKIDHIEIFNLAGHRIRELSFTDLPIAMQSNIPQKSFATSENWWDLRDDNNNLVSSGTYWVKLYGRLLDAEGKITSRVNRICKLVIVR